MKVSINKLNEYVGEKVTIYGWMFNKRGGGKIYFLQLRDGSGFVQGVLAKTESNEKVFSKAEKLTMESSVAVTGEVTKHPKFDNVFELQVSDIEILHLAEQNYPISKKEHGPDFLLDHRHLWLRSKKQWAIQKIRNTIIYGIYEYLEKENFILSTIHRNNNTDDPSRLNAIFSSLNKIAIDNMISIVIPLHPRTSKLLDANLNSALLTSIKSNKYIFMNKAHAEIYGYDSPSELIGKKWQILYTENDLKRFKDEIMPEFAENGFWRGRAIGKKKDGSTFPQEISRIFFHPARFHYSLASRA